MPKDTLREIDEFQGLCAFKINKKYCDKPATKTIDDTYYCDKHLKELADIVKRSGRG